MGSAAGRCFDACFRAPRRPRKRPALLPGGAYLQQIAASGMLQCAPLPRERPALLPVEQICSRALLQVCFRALRRPHKHPAQLPGGADLQQIAASGLLRSAPPAAEVPRATPRWSRSAAQACFRAPRRLRRRPALLPGGADLQQIAASGLLQGAPPAAQVPRATPRWSRSAADHCFRPASGRPAGCGGPPRCSPVEQICTRSLLQACFRAPRRPRKYPAQLPGGADLQQITASVLVQRALPAAEAPAQLPGGADLQQIAASGTTHRAGGWRERGAAGGGRGPNRTLVVAASRQAPRRAARAKRAPLDMFTRAERQRLTSP